MTRDPWGVKAPSTQFPLTESLTHRWSPRNFDAHYEIPDQEIGSLLEAARWSASSGNSQPWRFIVTSRGSEDFDRVASTLEGSNTLWAPHASALIVACAATVDAEGRSQRWCEYDLGQSMAYLTVAAEAIGLSVHQMGGFLPEVIREQFGLDDQITPVAVIAVGRFSPDAELPEFLLEREVLPRERLALSDLVLNESMRRRLGGID